MTKCPAMPEGEDMRSDEVIEWRDLQDAQMTALEDLWDNPEDECWNEDAPPPNDANKSAQGKKADTPKTSAG